MSADASIASQAGTSADATSSWRVFYVIGAVVGFGLVATYVALPESSVLARPVDAERVKALVSAVRFGGARRGAQPPQ